MKQPIAQFSYPYNHLDVFDKNIWKFKDPDCKTGQAFFESKIVREGVNPHWELIFKHYLVHKLGGFKGDQQYLSSSKTTLRVIMDGSMTFLRWASENHPDKYLVDMTEETINNFVSHLLDLSLTYGSVTLKMQFLRDSYKAYAYKHTPDGLLFDIDYLGRTPKPNSILHALCKKHGLDFSDWGRRKPHGSIPIYTAMTLLAYAIKDIRSNFTNFVTDYYAVLRLYKNKLGSDFRYFPNRLFDLYPEWLERGFDDPHKFLGKASEKGSENGEIIRREYYKCKRLGIAFDYKSCHKKYNLRATPNVTKDVFERNRSSWDISYDFCNDFYEVVSKYLKPEEVRYVTHCTITNYIANVLRPAVLIIFLCLTGSRSWSEIRHLRRKDVVLDSDNPKKARFTTPIKKTNHGIPEERDAFNLVSEAAQCIHVCRMDISEEQYLFSKTALGLLFTGTQYEPTMLSSGFLTSKLKQYYDKFGECQPNLYSGHPEIKAHQFRHTWAEFALRMFEGNVVEEIRQHFLHSYRSYMTNHYTFDKLTQEVSDDLVKKYLREVLGAIVSQEVIASLHDDMQKDIQGKAVQEIANSINDVVLEPEQVDSFVDDFVDTIADDYVHIRAHEYGYCLTKKSMMKFTACYDKESGVSNFDDARFTICSGCVSFCASKKNNEAAIIRQSIAHKEFANNRIEIFQVDEGDLLLQESLKAVENGNKILSQWKNNND